VVTGSPTRLVVLRHAKSAWPDVDDQERPLAARGRRDAPAVGRWLHDAHCVPDLVVCSTARRTRETWELVAAELDAEPEVLFDPRTYGASAAELLGVVREAPVVRRTVLLIGHQPGVQDLTLLLAGDAEDDVLERARTKFPTSAIAVLVAAGPWSELAANSALLTDFVIPRGRKP